MYTYGPGTDELRCCRSTPASSRVCTGHATGAAVLDAWGSGCVRLWVCPCCERRRSVQTQWALLAYEIFGHRWKPGEWHSEGGERGLAGEHYRGVRPFLAAVGSQSRLRKAGSQANCSTAAATPAQQLGASEPGLPAKWDCQGPARDFGGPCNGAEMEPSQRDLAKTAQRPGTCRPYISKYICARLPWVLYIHCTLA